MNGFSDSTQARRVKDSIIDWYSTSGRSFPWRSTSNPYHILIAEMLLRRTTATAVARVYPKFISRYEIPEKLASARLTTIASMIKTLGLQSIRSQHLHEMAHSLIENYNGVVPADLTQLAKLPGVGQYVASAVLNFAFGKNMPLVDGNIIHLMSRVFGQSFAGTTDRHLLALLDSFGLKEENKTFYWGVIDLVAKVCLRKAPRCTICPLAEECVWMKNNTLLSSS
jgi:A/G-specific adenine glycosylase